MKTKNTSKIKYNQIKRETKKQKGNAEGLPNPN